MKHYSRFDISGNSNKDGIVFRSSILPLEVKATYNDVYDVCITSEEGEQEIKDVKPWIITAIDTMLLLLAIYFRNVNVIIGILYFILFSSLELIDLIYAIYQVKFGSCRVLGKFHSAEHKAINAYRELKRVPSLEEVKKASRFHQNCGSGIIFRNIGTSLPLCIVLLSLSFVDVKIYIVEFVIAIAIVIISTKLSIIKYLQILVTNKPTDEELQVAIKGIEALQKKENDCISYINENNLLDSEYFIIIY